MKKLILSVLLLNLLAACSSNPPKEEVVASPAPVATAAPSNTDAQTAADARAAAAADAQAAAEAKAALLQNNNVYFPLNVDAIQASERATILNHAEYLASHPDTKVRVEGNADERGSSEYNLALGQRRANNTKNALVLGGAQSSQITTLSYGEEKPYCTEHNEECWEQNRRATINYNAK